MDMSGFMRRSLGIALAVGALTTVAAPAYADTFHLDILYIRCNNQSEPFSDEIRLRVNGDIVASWNNVDTGNVDWYYSSHTFAKPNGPLNMPFTGDSIIIDILEEDNEYNLIGWLEVPSSTANTGQHEWTARMYDGAYSIGFQVWSTPD
jgi:hypothetical protein